MNASHLPLRRSSLWVSLIAACLALGCGGNTEPGGPQSGAGGANTGGAGGASGGAGGASGSSGGDGGAGGNTTAGASGAAGGGAGGSGGTGGDAPSDVSPTEACIEYEVARHTRLDQCNQQPALSDAAYARQSLNCPDVYFSEGSTRTVESLLACAEVFRSFDCGLLTTARVPDCVTDGTLAAGAPCVFGPQCASLVCTGGGTGCGTCVMRLEPGAACADDITTGICPPGYSCSDGTCKENLDPEPIAPPIDPPQGDVPTGGACTSTEDCMGEDLCLGDGAGGQVCTARIPLNGDCNGPDKYCDESTYCSPEYVCLALPTQGQACGLSFGLPRWCAEGLTCDMLDPAGATCKPTSTTDCAAGGLQCPDDSVCCFEPECSTTMCVRIALPGETCGDASSRCINGAECTNGTCEPIDSQGLIESLCSP